MDETSAAPLREMWYMALPGAALKRGRMRAKTLLGEPLLFSRDDGGTAFALRDICPHRAMPLSEGSFDGREIECCYHGWRFAPSGQCTAIPSLAAAQDFAVDRIKVRSYPVREAHGLVWAYMGEDAAAAPPPAVPEIDERGPDLVESMVFPCALDEAVVGLMDPAHGPFVHRAWWWRSRRSIHEKAKAFAAAPFGFTMLRHPPSRNSNAYRLLGGAPETEITFRLPSTRIEHIRVGRHAVISLTAVTPIDAERSEVHHAIWWTLPHLSLMKPLLRPFVRAFLRQDRDVMARQQQGLRHRPPLLLINDADTQAKWYHRLKQEYARARAERRAFENPVKDRVLTWRS